MVAEELPRPYYVVGEPSADGTSDPDVPANSSILVREIYRRMQAAGLNPTSLARDAGRNPTYFRDLFKSDGTNPKVEFLPGIARALHCSVNDLLDPRGAKSEPDLSGSEYQAEEIALLGLWRLLSEAGRRRVMRAIIREARAIAGDIPENSPSD